MSGVDAVGPETGADGVQQQHLQFAPVNRVLGPPVSGVDASRFGPDRFTPPGVVTQVGGGNPGRGQGRTEIQGGEDADRMWQEVDAHAKGTDLPGGLEDNRMQARPVKAEGRDKSANAPATDEDDGWPARGRRPPRHPRHPVAPDCRTLRQWRWACGEAAWACGKGTGLGVGIPATQLTTMPPRDTMRWLVANDSQECAPALPGSRPP